MQKIESEAFPRTTFYAYGTQKHKLFTKYFKMHESCLKSGVGSVRISASADDVKIVVSYPRDL